MARPRREKPAILDVELTALPEDLRWREWMLRVEAVLFAASQPVKRETLAAVVGEKCNIDLLIDDLSAELAGRSFEIVYVAGGWQFRTCPRHADVLQSLVPVPATARDITETEMLVLASIAYQQPITRGALSDVLGREVSRDIIARLRDLNLIGSGPRAPLPGAPYTYVTTRQFLSYFGLDTLRDLPELEALEDAGLLRPDAASGATDQTASEPLPTQQNRS